MSELVKSHYNIRVCGIVQGVGFRPTVWRYANELGITGLVCNDTEGVLIKCRASQQEVTALIQRLQHSPPPQAQIDSIEEWKTNENTSYSDFEIAISQSNVNTQTGISPDLATCDECISEVFGKSSTRKHYAFTNCTHCGPRLSIIKTLPYDRENTSMSDFKQCPDCLKEYQDPTDRRFHAQPNACITCGPQVCLTDNTGKVINEDDPIAYAKQLLRSGKIIAVKGLGGFQIALDATNENATETLRLRKNRAEKPFALMAKNISMIEKYCELSRQERELLESSAAPIVLLNKRVNSNIANNVAPKQKRLGFMLPNTPLHHMLMSDIDYPIVLTSANISGQPQCIDNTDAIEQLSELVDFYLQHNRDIINRTDDSVVHLVNGQTQVIRRSRGYAPAPISLPKGFESCANTLALGGDLKNTFCLINNTQAVLSQHIGDLQDTKTYSDFQRTLNLYQNLYRFTPEVIAIDQHPQYHSSSFGSDVSRNNNVALIKVQHHHAHIASCLGDNNVPLDSTSVVAIVLDGMGYAEVNGNAQIWGGEIFVANYRTAERVAHLSPVALLGGNAAMRQPWRNCFAQLVKVMDWHQLNEKYSELPIMKLLASRPIETLLAMLEKQLNSPLSSSCGRLFDAVAAAIQVHTDDEISYEGQAAIALEECIDESTWSTKQAYSFPFDHRQQLIELNPKTMWQELLKDLLDAEQQGVIAAKFHRGLANGLATCANHIAQQRDIKRVVLSGGVMQNRHLQTAIKEQLEENGIEILSHHRVPANDGGLAFGQALIGAANTIPTINGGIKCA